MTIRELIDKLNHVENKDRLVIIAKDSEGNDHSPISCFWEGNYDAKTTWWGEVGLDVLTNELVDNGYTEEDVSAGYPALILCPVN